MPRNNSKYYDLVDRVKREIRQLVKDMERKGYSEAEIAEAVLQHVRDNDLTLADIEQYTQYD